MNKTLVIIAAVLGLIGLILNLAVDRDNVYDLTLSALWVLTLIFANAGAFMGGKRSTMPKVSSSSGMMQK
ncbi:MAG: hypothetical protein ACYC7D_07485 [Nitrososphaerales archaeon]